MLSIERPLDASGIDTASEWILQTLSKKITRQTIARVRLSAEETLTAWAKMLPQNTVFTAELHNLMGTSWLLLRAKGIRADPLEKSSRNDEIGDRLLQSLGFCPLFKYRRNENTVTIPFQHKRHDLLYVFISLVLGMLCSSLLTSVYPAVGRFIAQNVLIAMFDKMQNIIRLISMPLIFFSICCGILELGDISMLGKIGKTLIRPVLFIPLFCSFFAAAAMFPFVQISRTVHFSGAESFKTIFTMILAIIPDSIIQPFSEGNPLQLICLAMIFAVAVLTAGDRARNVSDFTFQINTVCSIVASAFSRFIPILVFLSAFTIAYQGLFSQIADILFVLVFSIVYILVIMTLHVVFICIRFRISPAVIIRGAADSTFIELVTASSSAALSQREEECRKLGVSPTVTKFVLPFLQVANKNLTAGIFIIVLLGISRAFAVQISLAQLVTCSIMSALLSIAVPPVPGSSFSALTLLCAILGFPSQAVSLCLATMIITDYIETPGNCFCHIPLTIFIANKVDMLDRSNLE